MLRNTTRTNFNLQKLFTIFLVQCQIEIVLTSESSVSVIKIIKLLLLGHTQKDRIIIVIVFTNMNVCMLTMLYSRVSLLQCMLLCTSFGGWARRGHTPYARLTKSLSCETKPLQSNMYLLPTQLKILHLKNKLMQLS